jgi:hypothetical protein
MLGMNVYTREQRFKEKKRKNLGAFQNSDNKFNISFTLKGLSNEIEQGSQDTSNYRFSYKDV